MNPTPIGGDPGAPQDTTRLMLTALLLVGLYGTWTFFLAPKPDPTAPVAAEAPAESETVQLGNPTPTTAPTPLGEAAGGATPPQPERFAGYEADVAGSPDQQIQTIEGGYRATVTNHGAQIASFVLTGYDDTADRDEVTGALHLYNLVSDASETAAMLAIQSRGGDVKHSKNDAYELVAEDHNQIVFRRKTAEGVRISRRYVFDDNRFGFSHELTVTNEGTTARTIELDLLMNGTYRQGGGSFFAPQSDGGDAASCRVAGDHEGYPAQDLVDDGTQHVVGPVSYVANSDRYFLNALMPENVDDTVGCRAETYKPDLSADPDQEAYRKQEKKPPLGVLVALELAPMTLAPGESKTVTQKAYFGPKQLQLLEAEGGHLEENIEFGIFGILSKPILWTLVKLHDATGNFGVAIILLTLLIKLLTFPLTQKSYVSMQQMKTLAPELKKLQEKYASDRAALGQKQMELYKEKGINPLAGCFPMLVQMPVWFALYRTLWTSVELYQKPFFSWITDLSQPDVFPVLGFAALPFVVGALMLFQTSLQPPPQDQPQMKYVLWAMPVMFTFFMFSMPSGLSLYMITNSGLTMFQQLYIKKKYA